MDQLLFNIMAHFAQLNEQNIVVNVIVVHDSVLQDKNGIESEELGKQWLIQWSGGHYMVRINL